MADDKYKSAGTIRSKITKFDFEDAAKANQAIVEQIGDVASIIGRKSDEQNRRFDKLLKVLEFLPKDALEQRKQQKILFTEMAKTTAAIEKAAKEEKNPLKKVELLNQARDLRRQGSYLAPDHDPSKSRSIKETLANKLFGLAPEDVRKKGVFGATKIGGLLTTDIGDAILGRKDDAFGKAVEQEKLYEDTTVSANKTGFEARLRGGIKNTDEDGIKRGRERSVGTSASRAGMEGIGSSIVLRKISDTVIEIRDYIIGKKGGRASNTDTPDEPPKGLFSKEELDKRDPRNYGIKTKGKQKGRKYWNKRSKYGNRRFLTPGEEDIDPDSLIPDTPPDIMEMGLGHELTDEQKAKAAGTYDSEHTKTRLERQSEDGSMKDVVNERTLIKEGQDQPQPKYAESGIEKEEPTKVEGGMTGSDDGSGLAVLAILGAISEAIVAGLALGGPIALGVGAIGIAVKDVYEYIKTWNIGKTARSEIEETTSNANDYLASVAKKHGMTVPEMMEYNRKHGSAGAQQTEDLYTGKLKRDKWNNPYEVESEISPFEDLARWADPNAAEDSKKLSFGPFFKNGMIEQNKFNKSNKGAWLDFGANGKEVPMVDTRNGSGDALEQGAATSSAPTVIAPTTNNIVNNNVAGGGSTVASDPSMPSVRTPDPSIQRWQDKRQNRTF